MNRRNLLKVGAALSMLPVIGIASKIPSPPEGYIDARFLYGDTKDYMLVANNIGFMKIPKNATRQEITKILKERLKGRLDWVNNSFDEYLTSITYDETFNSSFQQDVEELISPEKVNNLLDCIEYHRDYVHPYRKVIPNMMGYQGKQLNEPGYFYAPYIPIFKV